MTSPSRSGGFMWKKLLTYLRLMNERVGLLLNFGGNTLVEACAASLTISLPPRRRASA